MRMNFNEAVTKLLDVGGYVAVASHDEWVIAEAVRIFAERGLAPEQYEFQMLLGVRAGLGDGSCARAIASGSTSRSAGSGTSTRCAGCRRTRRSPATSPPTPSSVPSGRNSA